jgi:ATP-dependent DNA ligase
VDGEIVIPIGGKLSFDALLMRIHPAARRIARLSRTAPCLFILFDLLLDPAGKALINSSLRLRRRALVRFAKKFLPERGILRLSPCTKKLAVAKKWYHMGVGLDGIVAKRDDLPYQTGQRAGMQKIKAQRTAECVVGGFRYLEKKQLVGSLLLGLFDDEGRLNHVGFTSSIRDYERPSLTRRLEHLVKPPGFTGKAPGGRSRWSRKRSHEWKPLDPRLVAEVQFDHFAGGRFRHGTKFLRWRPEKEPSACTMKKVERENKSALNLL